MGKKVKRESLPHEAERLCRGRMAYGDGEKGAKKPLKDQFYSEKKVLEAQGKEIDNKYSHDFYKCFYREDTMSEYAAEVRHFGEWLRDQNGGRRVPLEEAADRVPEYLAYLQAHGKKNGEPYGPGTLKKKRAQLSKAYCRDYCKEIYLPGAGAESEQGRGKDAHYDRFSDRNAAATAFYQAVGVRGGEYRNLPRNDWHTRAARCEKLYGIRPEPIKGCLSNLVPVYDAAGQVEKVITLHAKHGRTNCMPILEKDRAAVTEAFKSGDFVKYWHPSDHAGTHQCRREKAQALYDSIARDVATLPRSELYCTQAKYGARVYDRAAVAYVAESLGHGKHRLFDTVHKYLR